MSSEITQTTEKIQDIHLNDCEFIIHNAEKYIKHSFKKYRQGKQLDKNFIDSWRISEVLKENNFTTEENLNEIPTLGDLLKTQINNSNTNTASNSQVRGKLIKFNYCVQNIIENQIYLAISQTKDNKVFTNKYHEFNDKQNKVKDENQMNIEEDLEEDLGCGADYSNTILSERLMLNAIPIPGLTRWAADKYNLDTEDLLQKKKILIYEYENHAVKVNDQRMSVGIAYVYTDCIIIHNWISFDKFLTSEIPKKIEFSKDDFKIARENLFEFLNNIFEDKVFSDYLILSLTSQVISRVGTNLLGKLSVNLISGNDKAKKLNPENNSQESSIGSTNYTFKETLKIILSNIVLSLIDIKISIKSLNQDLFVPRFDVETEELNQGILQIMKDTMLLIDEIEMVEGKLGNTGIINVAALKNLIEFQMLHYEFPYSKIEIPQECKIITLSEGKSLFKSAALLELKMQSGFGNFISKNAEEVVNSYMNNNLQAFDLFRNWFMRLHEENFTKDFSIDNDVSQGLQKDFLDNKASMTADDFDRCLNLTKLYCLSYGRKTMTIEDYNHIKNLEKSRSERLN